MAGEKESFQSETVQAKAAAEGKTEDAESDIELMELEQDEDEYFNDFSQ